MNTLRVSRRIDPDLERNSNSRILPHVAILEGARRYIIRPELKEESESLTRNRTHRRGNLFAINRHSDEHQPAYDIPRSNDPSEIHYGSLRVRNEDRAVPELQNSASGKRRVGARTCTIA